MCILLITPFPAAGQETNISPQGNMPTRNDAPPNQIKEETDGLEVNMADGTDEKDPEGSSEGNSIDNEDGAPAEPDPLSSGKDDSVETEVPVNKETGGKRKLQMQGKWRGVDPVIFFKDETIINTIKTFYGIDDSFPLDGHLVSRNSETNHVKRIYYISKSVKDVLELNIQVGQQLKITSVGLKMFVSIHALLGFLFFFFLYLFPLCYVVLTHLFSYPFSAYLCPSHV